MIKLLLCGVVVLFIYDNSYLENNKDISSSCVEDVENTVVIKDLEFGRSLVIPCEVWFDPDKLRTFLYNCRYGDHSCIEIEL